MAFISMFDHGTCSVAVLMAGEFLNSYQEIMTKGSSDTFSYSGETYTIAVDSNGVVSLETDAPSPPSSITVAVWSYDEDNELDTLFSPFGTTEEFDQGGLVGDAIEYEVEAAD